MNQRKLGSEKEQDVCVYLETQGYQILERNFRCRMGEIDIVAMDGAYHVFVEVKYRTTDAHGTPAAAVDYRKQQVISKVALYYCTKHGLLEQPSRFDVVAVAGDGTMQVYKNAFEYCYK